MKKLWFLYLLISFGFFVIIVRLFMVQVLHSELLKEADYVKTTILQPERGIIFDANEKPMVLNQTVFQLYAEPQKIKDIKETIEKLDQILKLGESTLEGLLSNKNQKLWIPIYNYTTSEQKALIEKQQIEGIGFVELSQRYYPESSASAHLLGFVGKNSDGENIGYYGLEGYYERDLKGIPGISRNEIDPIGKPIVIGIQQQIDPENGRNLYLSVDLHVQIKTKNVLKKGIEKYGAKAGCIIVADPNTMFIISLVCLPDYDPALYSKFGEPYFINKAISELFEPGSIFKPLIMAAALNEKKVKPDDVYNETGPIQIGEYPIRTWNNKYSGSISMSQIIEKSSNVGMVYVGEKLGKDKLISYLHDFGFGQKTQIDLEGEVAGYIKPSTQWYPIDYATVTFGQGIVVTPIQMLRAFASLINGGYLLQPRVVTRFENAENKERTLKKIIKKRVISEQTSKDIIKILEKTIKNGEAKWDVPKGYRMGGKTGTAQIPIGGSYDLSKTNASFIGFFPVDKPRFIALVTLKEPSASPWASETAAPLFFELAEELILYYNIAPE